MICGVTTSPRKKCFLGATINSAITSGFKNIVVFSEPASELPCCVKKAAIIIQNSQKRGQWLNWLHMATKLSAFSEKLVLTFEDDVRFSKSAATVSKKILTKLLKSHGNECGPLCVYTSSVYQKRMKRQVEPIDPRSLIGACALLWPMHALRRVVQHDLAKNWKGISGNDNSEDIRHSDTCIGACCHELGLKVFGMRPCYAQHIGTSSSLGRQSMDATMFASAVAP